MVQALDILYRWHIGNTTKRIHSTYVDLQWPNKPRVAVASFATLGGVATERSAAHPRDGDHRGKRAPGAIVSGGSKEPSECADLYSS